MTPERYVLAARLVSYLGDRAQALVILTDGLAEHPGDLRLLHQRGTMRLITRSLTQARDDFEAAVRHDGDDASDTYREQVVGDVLALVLEPHTPDLGSASARSVDAGGQVPAAHGSVRTGAWLHLGVTHYLLGDYAAAAQALDQARQLARAPHQKLAAVDWLYLSLYRSGQREAAQAVVDDLDWDAERLGGAASTTARSLEQCYVQRLRLYRGEARPEELLRATSNEGIDVATLGYGVGVWYQCRGYTDAAARTFERILEVGDPTTMGYLAAETERNRAAQPSGAEPTSDAPPHPSTPSSEQSAATTTSKDEVT